MHQSFNQTDQTRYCLFVDIVRPTPFPRLFAELIGWIGRLCLSFSHMFYRNWKVLEPNEAKNFAKKD